MNIKENIPYDFMNRELSWLSFNDRILELADSPNMPLIERAKFLKITQSNLDEWYMIRVANLIREVSAGDKHPDPSGMTPNTQLNHVRRLVKQQLKKQAKIWRKINKLFTEEGIELIKYDQLLPNEKKVADDYFNTTIAPLIEIELLPKDIPWPELKNDILYFIIDMVSAQDNTKRIPATFGMPDLPRVFKLPSKPNRFILLEQIIKAHSPELIKNAFKGRYIEKNTYVYRILKDMDIRSLPKNTINTELAVDEALDKLDDSPVIFLAVDEVAPSKTVRSLTNALSVNPLNSFHIHGDCDYNFIGSLLKSLQSTNQLDLDDLKFKKRLPYHEPDLCSEDIFANIEKKDYLLQHPYDSYDAVVNFFEQAAKDPEVKEVYVSLYRVAKNSRIVQALIDAAKNGKKVVTLVEVKARFDESNNIKVADHLRDNGVKVYTSFPDLKIHGKLAMVVKKDKKAYVHLATGNYNEVTAGLYTDFSFFTANKKYSDDVKRIFQFIQEKKPLPKKLNKIYIAPNMLRDRLLHEIRRMVKKAQLGEKAEIWIKSNSLSDQKTIKALYKANQQGVKIHLIVRGIATAIPGIGGISNHIHIHSIVGRLLEHSRIYIFTSTSGTRIYISSADVMPRNFDRRVETLVPIEDKDLKDKIYTIFKRMWNDRAQSFTKQTDGFYTRRISNKNAQKQIPIQEQFLIEAQNRELEIEKSSSKENK